MAITTANFQNLFGKDLGDSAGRTVTAYRVTGDAAYATGGSVPAVGSFGKNLQFTGVAANISGNVTRTYQWNNDTQKLMAFTTATGAQVGNGTDLSADVILLIGIVGG